MSSWFQKSLAFFVILIKPVLLYARCMPKSIHKMGRVKRIWYLPPMRAAKVQASLRIRAVSPEPPLLALTGSESRGTFRQKARSLAPLNGWACAVKICQDGMLEDTNSLDAARVSKDWPTTFCIQNFHLGRYNVGYTVGNFVLRLSPF